MACVSPPELDERTLLGYIDGQASVDTETHITRCSHCRERAHRLARLQGRITVQLYRIDCPSPFDLGEYHLGLLPAAQREVIRRHLDECPRCAGEIAQLQKYLEALEPDLEFSLLERVTVWIARLVDATQFGLPRVGPSPALAGTRGQEDGLHVYQANDVQIAIEVQDDIDQSGQKILMGLITGMKDPHVLKAYLWRASQCVATAIVDELGNLAIAGLEPDRYELILSGPDIEIHIQELRIGINQE